MTDRAVRVGGVSNKLVFALFVLLFLFAFVLSSYAMPNGPRDIEGQPGVEVVDTVPGSCKVIAIMRRPLVMSDDTYLYYVLCVDEQ